MKKCDCGFETRDNEYEFCPKCGEILETDKSKTSYTMGIDAEDSFDTEIEMTYEEAKIVNRVLKDLASKSKLADSYTGYCWIDFE